MDNMDEHDRKYFLENALKWLAARIARLTGDIQQARDFIIDRQGAIAVCELELDKYNEQYMDMQEEE